MELNYQMQQSQTDQSPFLKEALMAAKHSAIYVSGQALSRLVGFIMIPVYTRFITPGDYGTLELVYVVSGVLAMLISMGVSDSMSRFYYAEKEQRRRDLVV